MELLQALKGTDVSWCPTSHAMVEAMLDLAKLRSDDVLIDLGSGDGRIVIAAAKRGITKAIGIEDNPVLVRRSREAAVKAGMPFRLGDPLVEFRCQSLFEANTSEATVVMLFLDREPHKKLLRKLVTELRPGTRIISNTFHLWEHEREIEMETGDHFKIARMWLVPGGSYESMAG